MIGRAARKKWRQWEVLEASGELEKGGAEATIIWPGRERERERDRRQRQETETMGWWMVDG